MAGTLALQGGGPFEANDELDRRLLAEVAAEGVVVLPTADAFETPGDLVASATRWGARVGVEVRPLMVLHRHDAEDEEGAAVVREARAVYLVGDSAMHLRSTLKETPLFDAIEAVLAGGGLVTGVGSSATALCDPMLDQRGGAFTLGLGLARGMAVVPAAETRSEERRARTLALADTTVVELPTGSAVVRRGDDWELVGAATVVHGELP